VLIATWNVNSLNVRLPHVVSWLELQAQEQAIDYLCLQELKLTDDKFPTQALRDVGYDAVFHGQKTYNGVATLARTDQEALPSIGSCEVVKNNPRFADAQARLIATDLGAFQIVNGYFPNGQALDSEKFTYKLEWLDALIPWVAELQKKSPVILLGDFNITADARDVYDPALLEGQIHCSEQERSRLLALQELGLFDAFRAFEQPEKSYSWWDYRQGAFRRNAGLRIDHILIDERLRDCLLGCTIDLAPRRWEQPSDHTPVIAELDLSQL
jgi:exodeoxyribonuclease III